MWNWFNKIGVEKSQNAVVGEMGERLAARFLEEDGYRIVARNYRKKWGEIDIVAKKRDTLHFVEVKSVSHETGFAPEGRVGFEKMKRLGRVIETYLLENKVPHETNYQIDVLCVCLERQGNERFELIEDVFI